ncbi:hypothetical protein V1514DRAFT_317404 [Lipomyces japonicus]|uniref:uncharacterized protein n=1 Tax=Lipomyces japonicus TaxID=56871 RepID=UPI0034CD35BB
MAIRRDHYWTDNESDDDFDGSEIAVSDAQIEWDESFRQIQFIFSAFLFPIVGKYFGRLFALTG